MASISSRANRDAEQLFRMRSIFVSEREAMNMNQTNYNEIADWYDRYLSEHPIYLELLLPHLLELVGEVEGERVCDLACGQGWFARELARRGARVTGIDVSGRLLEIARRHEQEEPLGIDYRQEDARLAASLAAGSFDGVVCVLALMDMPEIEPVSRTMRRLLKPGGWLVVALTHPCFELPGALAHNRRGTDSACRAELFPGGLLAVGVGRPAQSRRRLSSHAQHLSQHADRERPGARTHRGTDGNRRICRAGAGAAGSAFVAAGARSRRLSCQ